MTSEVQSYFDRQADAYQDSSSSLVWGWQRRREAKAVFDLLGPIAGEPVLELGCGAGYYTRELIRRGAAHVTAVDFSRAMLDQLPDGPITPIHADAARVRPEGRFARILSAGLMEFVPDAASVLANARNCATEEDGVMVCLFPPDNPAGRLYRVFHGRHGFRITLFSLRAFRGMAQDCGWQVAASRSVFPYALAVRLTTGPGA